MNDGQREEAKILAPQCSMYFLTDILLLVFAYNKAKTRLLFSVRKIWIPSADRRREMNMITSRVTGSALQKMAPRKAMAMVDYSFIAMEQE